MGKKAKWFSIAVFVLSINGWGWTNVRMSYRLTVQALEGPAEGVGLWYVEDSDTAIHLRYGDFSAKFFMKDDKIVRITEKRMVNGKYVDFEIKSPKQISLEMNRNSFLPARAVLKIRKDGAKGLVSTGLRIDHKLYTVRGIIDER